MSIVLELTPAEEEALRREAGAQHVDVTTYVRARVFPLAYRLSPDGNADPGGKTYRIDDALAALESLEDPRFRVTEEDWKALTRGIEESRPGQRAVFGPGTNPTGEPAR